MIKGLKVHPEDPLQLDFIVDTGNSGFKVEGEHAALLRAESGKLIQYFLAALTIPEKDFWVNLSPYEQDRMMPEALGRMEIGRDMLAQDYLLKQLTASLIYPEKDLGKAFWDRVYAKAQQRFSAVDIPVDTFNKVWITADTAKVLERDNTAFVVDAHLKVMLESDYQAARYAKAQGAEGSPRSTDIQDDVKKIIRTIILPEIEKEVNQGKNFAPLRQIYHAMILAAWYKQALKHALLNQAYSDKAKISGALADDPAAKDKIYDQYIQAYKKGVFNYIKDETDALSRQSVPHKYFSGGEVLDPSRVMAIVPTVTAQELAGLKVGDQAMVQTKISAISSDRAMDDKAGELPTIAEITDMRAIKYYSDVIKGGGARSYLNKQKTLRQMRQQKLLDRLNAVAVDIGARSKRVYDGLRAELFGDFSDEMNVRVFIDQQVAPFIARAEDRKIKRFKMGYTGKFASGKTTVADFIRDELVQNNIPWKVRTFSFDDFLRPKEKRIPVDTENFFEKFDVQRYKEFMRLLDRNELAMKPIYDQTSKGQLEFGLDEDGKVTLFDGEQEMVIDGQGSSAVIESFMVERDKKNGQRGKRIKTLERQAISKRAVPQKLILGSTPVSVERARTGAGFTVRIKDSRFDIMTREGKFMLAMEGAAPVELRQDNKVEALEAWAPVASADPSDRELVIGEGIGVLFSDLFDITANVNVTAAVRHVRSMIREWIRGRKDSGKDTQHAEVLTVREFSEDVIIDNLNREAIRRRGMGVEHQTHFHINNMTLPEQILRNYIYGLVTVRHKRFFKSEGLDLDELIKGMKSAESTAFKDWLQTVIAQTPEPFTTPKPFPGEKIGNLDEGSNMYWEGSSRTVALGRFLLLKFMLSPSGRFGDLDPEAEAHLQDILNRTQGLTAGGHIFDLSPDNIVMPYLDPAVKPAGELRQVALKKVLLMNQLQFMESVLNDLQDRYNDAKEKSAPADEIEAEGQRWISDFFRVQSELAKMGIIDIAPSLARRYGKGASHGSELVLGVASLSYKLDGEALDAVDAITATENASRAAGFMKTLIDQYPDLPGIKDLQGFQLRFMGNSDMQEDYLARIPAVFRPFYVAQVKLFPKDRHELSLSTGGFGAAWAHAKEKQMARTFKNGGAFAIPMHYRMIESVAGVVAEHALAGLQLDFKAIMRQRTSKDKVGTKPALQWVAAYRASLQENQYDFLYSMVKAMQDHCLDAPDWLDHMTGKDVETVYATVLQDLTEQRSGKLPMASPWQQDIFRKVVQFALELPADWNDFDAGTVKDGSRSDAAMLDPGGIDLNATDLGMDIVRESGPIDMPLDPAMVASFEKGDFAGVEGIIVKILPIDSLWSTLGLSTPKIP